MKPKIVFFDALYTLVKPRIPIAEQYAQVFKPYFALDPADIAPAFKTALKAVQRERPAYVSAGSPRPGVLVSPKPGSGSWWHEVISRTALGAGADPTTVEQSLKEIVPKLIARFSSAEGYALYDDVIPTLTKLHAAGIRTGIVSNSDGRMRHALEDLEVEHYFDPILLSEMEGVEKPDPIIWERALTRAGVWWGGALHVGDELEADYRGARQSDIRAVLLRRPEEAAANPDEDLSGVMTISSLLEIPDIRL